MIILKNNLPKKFLLSTPFPNPFNSSVSIHFSLPQLQHALLQVFNTNGQIIETLVNQILPNGDYQNKWNAIGQSTGVYIVKLTTPNFIENQKNNLFKMICPKTPF